MSQEQDFQKELEASLNLLEDSIKTPHMPVAIYIQEACSLEHWIREDKEQLLLAGLKVHLVESLPPRIALCQDAQSRWIKERKKHLDVQVRWKQCVQEAFQLRDELLRSYRFAFYKHPNALASIANIGKDQTHAAMIQDLVNLSVVGREQKSLLALIQFDLNKIELAEETANQAADLLAEFNGQRRMGNQNKMLRDRAFTHLKEAIDEIRRCGKYVFWNDKRRLQGYFSAYTQKRGAKQRRSVMEPKEQ